MSIYFYQENSEDNYETKDFTKFYFIPSEEISYLSNNITLNNIDLISNFDKTNLWFYNKINNHKIYNKSITFLSFGFLSFSNILTFSFLFSFFNSVSFFIFKELYRQTLGLFYSVVNIFLSKYNFTPFLVVLI